ncbi:MAG: hypothetical protein P8M12_09835 [Flavobacteriales bacterium]|jgi:hypothetical protein|nr:hypothetical protein [Flavobacteriales bacterium]
MKRLIITLFVCSFVFVGCYNTDTGIDKGGCIDGDCVNGYGSFSWSDNYEGEWADGKRNGEGTMNWSDGTKYVGDWKDDKRDGQGAYTYGKGEWEGDHYDGEWKNDFFNGQGTYTKVDGAVAHSGLWIDGQPSE